MHIPAKTALILSLLAITFLPNDALAAISGTTRVASGLSAPLFATHAPGDPNHLFVLEQGGNIKVVDLTTRSVLTTQFLNIPEPLQWLGRAREPAAILFGHLEKLPAMILQPERRTAGL